MRVCKADMQILVMSPEGDLVKAKLAGVDPARGLPHRLKHGPRGGRRQQPLEQVQAAKLADEVGAPPAEPSLFAHMTLASPRDDDLGAQQRVHLRGEHGDA